eukprot:UN01207
MKLISVVALVAVLCVLLAVVTARQSQHDYYDYDDYNAEYDQFADESPADFDLDNDFATALAASTVPGCNVVNKSPYYNQPNGYTCGATSLRMVMAAYGTSKTIDQICSAMGGCGTSGVGRDQIITAAKKFGFSNARVLWGWDNLEAAIAAGKTVVAHVRVQAGGYPRHCSSGSSAYSSYTGGHYIVVYGLNCNDSKTTINCVNVNDPANTGLQAVKYSKSSFDQAWVNGSDRAFIVLK